MSTPTPAPWMYRVVNPQGDCEVIASRENWADGFRVAIVPVVDNFPGRAEANARILAAAPRLLEALDDLSAAITRGKKDGITSAMMRASAALSEAGR